MTDFREYQAAFRDHNDDLAHFGILGMKWGVRRYQNPDGTLTEAGRKRYDKLNKKLDEANDNYYKYWKRSYGSEDGRGTVSDRLKVSKYFDKVGKLMRKTGRYDLESPADRLKREKENTFNDQLEAKKAIEKDGFKKDKYGEYSKKIDGAEHSFRADDIEGSAACYKDYKIFMRNKDEHYKQLTNMYKQQLTDYRDDYIKWAKKNNIDQEAIDANTKYFNDMLKKATKPNSYAYDGRGNVWAFFNDGVDDLFGPNILYNIEKRSGQLSMDD